MACLFQAYPREEHQALLDGVREMTADFEAQVGWRFRYYFNFPYSWSAIHHPSVPLGERQRLVRSFFDDFRDCCRDPASDGKIFDMYKECPDRVSRILEDKNFVNLIKARDLSHKFTNCGMERLLASFRRWCSVEGSQAERVCSAGFLGQLLGTHNAAGGNDPRGVSREQLVEDGVALRRCSGKRYKRSRSGGQLQRPCGAFVHWMKSQTQPPGLGRPEYADWLRGKGNEFHELPQLQKDLNAQQAQRDFYKQNNEDDSPDPLPRLAQAVETMITHFGDKQSPLRTDVFAKAVCQKCGVPEDSVVGFTRYSALYRPEAQQRMFVPDDGCIDPAMKYSYTLPCPLAHPGHCAGRDKAYLPMLHVIVKEAFSYFLSQPRGSFHQVRVIGPGPPIDHKVAWLMVSHSRLANPKVTQQ